MKLESPKFFDNADFYIELFGELTFYRFLF